MANLLIPNNCNVNFVASQPLRNKSCKGNIIVKVLDDYVNKAAAKNQSSCFCSAAKDCHACIFHIIFFSRELYIPHLQVLSMPGFVLQVMVVIYSLHKPYPTPFRNTLYRVHNFLFLFTDSITSTAVAVPGLLYDSRTTSQSRTQVFQLSTTATGLTEIQQLFHET